MKATIVGGNSPVGTELTALLAERGWEVLPVVRHRLTASFLRARGYGCAVGDVTEDAELAERVYSDADVVVLAAFASPRTRRGFEPSVARETNRSLVRSAARQAPARATLIYLSTIHAFGPSVGPSRWTWYGVEKRATERDFLSAEAPAERLVLRLGQVFGPNQDKTDKIVSPVTSGEYGLVSAAEADPSNVVHTVTIVDAIEHCHSVSPPEERYSVVNSPQWSWGRVYDHYLADGESVRFTGRGGGGGSPWVDGLRAALGELQSGYRSQLKNVFRVGGRGVSLRLSHDRRRKNMREAVNDYWDRVVFDTHEFHYRPAPGPFLDGIDATEEKMSEYGRIQPLFDPEGRCP